MVPTELYGIIFFAMGVIAAIASLALSFYHLRPVRWHNPIGPVEAAKIDGALGELEWKTVIYDDLCACNEACGKVLTAHAKTLKLSLIFFVIGITILSVIKFF